MKAILSLIRQGKMSQVYHYYRYWKMVDTAVTKKDTDPYNISSMGMGSLWQSKTYLQNTASLLIRQYGNRRGLDISKEAMWISVCERAAKLQAFNVGGLKEILPLGQCRTTPCCPGLSPEQLDYAKSLMDHNFVALWPKETHSTSFGRSKPFLLTYVLTGPF